MQQRERQQVVRQTEDSIARGHLARANRDTGTSPPDILLLSSLELSDTTIYEP